jgi:hypothetical protein
MVEPLTINMFTPFLPEACLGRCVRAHLMGKFGGDRWIAQHTCKEWAAASRIVGEIDPGKCILDNSPERAAYAVEVGFLSIVSYMQHATDKQNVKMIQDARSIRRALDFTKNLYDEEEDDDEITNLFIDLYDILYNNASNDSISTIEWLRSHYHKGVSQFNEDIVKTNIMNRIANSTVLERAALKGGEIGPLEYLLFLLDGGYDEISQIYSIVKLKGDELTTEIQNMQNTNEANEILCEIDEVIDETRGKKAHRQALFVAEWMLEKHGHEMTSSYGFCGDADEVNMSDEDFCTGIT